MPAPVLDHVAGQFGGQWRCVQCDIHAESALARQYVTVTIAAVLVFAGLTKSAEESVLHGV